MLDYGQAVAILRDPQADPVLLARIAYEYPEYGAQVAAHPRAYPGLLRWIARFGSAQARQAAARAGFTAADGPVEARRPGSAGGAHAMPAHAAGAHAAGAHAASHSPAHGFTARQASTTTDPAVMQRIAQEAPELHAALAANPCLYGELRQWLAHYGGADVAAALRQAGR